MKKRCKKEEGKIRRKSRKKETDKKNAERNEKYKDTIKYEREKN